MADRGELETGPVLDRLVHEMLGGDRGPEDPIPAYSTDAACIGPLLDFLGGRCRYFGLIHGYEGIWYAVDANEVGELPNFDQTVGPCHAAGATRSEAVCRLAVSLPDEGWELPGSRTSGEDL
jgi:hypothetical protein